MKAKRSKKTVTSGLDKATIVVNVCDGNRKPLPEDLDILFRIRDGNNREIHTKSLKSSTVSFKDLPFSNNFADNYTVIASAKGYAQAGFRPVKVSPSFDSQASLMLLPMNAQFDFAEAKWIRLQETHPLLCQLLASGARNDETARRRYGGLLEKQPDCLASFLNVTTAMTSIHLPKGNPLEYFTQLIWDTDGGAFSQFCPDRFFGYAKKELLDQVRIAADQGVFTQEVGPGVFHKGATTSYKQVQLGEANVQLTFHEGDAKKIDGVDCILVEPDLDYYRDILAHAFLEVIPNTVKHGKTDPKVVYMLRWIAGKQAGIPAFNPPYRIV